MRWADLDMLGHVNNAVFVDYLQEARVDMLLRNAPDTRGGDLAEGLVVARHEVEYVAPLTLSERSVSIECWVTDIRTAAFTMAYELFREAGGRRTVYVRARTVLTPYVFAAERPRRLTDTERETLAAFAEPEPPAPRGRPPATVTGPGRYPVQVRFSDVDVYGHVNNVKYFDYFQEARILLLEDLRAGLSAHDLGIVVAQVDVGYRHPIIFRSEPYDAFTGLGRVGHTSVEFLSEIRDGDTLFARARVVGVFFDRATERPAAPPSALRERLVAASA